MHVPFANFLNNIGFIWSGSLAVFGIFIISAMLAGLRTYRLQLKYQRALDHLNLKTGLGHSPKVLSVDSLNDDRTRIIVNSAGIGEERYKSKLDDLRSAVGQKIESVNYCEKDNRLVEISLAHKLLDNNIKYCDLFANPIKSYSFAVGKSLSKTVIENLEDVPHYLIAGSTGGGKSVAFKSMLLGLLESSTKIQMYLFDFKQVEMNDFSNLKNVKIFKDQHSASLQLEGLVAEMDKRYKYLESINEKKIDPIKHNLDRIVVGIDECADLLGKANKGDTHYEPMERAKRCLGELARKSRAAGIHLIFATQKVDQTSIATQIQENLEGRLSFRMNTIENSVRVLQNGMSYYLPSIPGRAIWKRGATYTEVQCPFISDHELLTRLDEIRKRDDVRDVQMIAYKDGKTEEKAVEAFVEGQVIE